MDGIPIEVSELPSALNTMRTNQQKQLITERDRAFEHAVRQYYIRCADRSIGLAPLEQFRNALDALKDYDQAPTDRNRELLKKTYRALKKTPDEFGYSPVGEIYHGLRMILYWALYKRDRLVSSITQHFAEAKYLAALSVWKTMSYGQVWEPTAVLRAEYDHQHQISSTLMNDFFTGYKNSNREYLSLKAA